MGPYDLSLGIYAKAQVLKIQWNSEQSELVIFLGNQNNSLGK